MTVKVPHGFRDKDLARPVVEIRDFKNGRLAYEIYSFGQDIVVNPINDGFSKSSQNFGDFKSQKRRRTKKERFDIDVIVKADRVILKADLKHASQNIEIYANQEFIFTGSLSRNSDITLNLSNREGRKILKEVDRNKDIYGKIK